MTAHRPDCPAVATGLPVPNNALCRCNAAAGREVDARPYLDQPTDQPHRDPAVLKILDAVLRAAGYATAADIAAALRADVEQLTTERDAYRRQLRDAHRDADQLSAELVTRTAERDQHARDLAGAWSALGEARETARRVIAAHDVDREHVERIRTTLEAVTARCDLIPPEYGVGIRDLARDLLAMTAPGTDRNAPLTPVTPSPVPTEGSTESDPADGHTAARARSCPTCHSIGAPHLINTEKGPETCPNPWHAPPASASLTHA